MFNSNYHKTILITGANRGLGKELASYFSHEKWNVISCIRNLKNPMNCLDTNHIQIKLNVKSNKDIENLERILGENAVDVVIHNAGVFAHDKFCDTSISKIIEMYKVNALAPLIISEKIINHIIKGQNKLILVMTGRMGSFSNHTGGESYGYRMSKAAANMVVKTMAIDLKKHQVKILSIHPGWIKTRMGGQKAKVNISDSVKGINDIIINASNYKTGGYYTYLGEELEW